MKKSAIISSHLILWVIFTLMVIAQSKLFLEAKPDAPFGSHFAYVVSLEVVMGMIFFYLTYFTFTWAGKKPVNAFITGAILLLLLLVFAFPAMKIGVWQVVSSVVPHLGLIYLAIIFRFMVRKEKG
ncbi:MAG TPA: hypothetical protein PLW67_00895 [Prolixibacteraceae bacterium]|nr:hypothetical protein [Prolixibacteraceae bacterium]